jgi:hypothetical protein
MNDRKVIRSSIPSILGAVRKAINHSSKALRDIEHATENADERSQQRKQIESNLYKDFQNVILHGIGYHVSCRPEVCSSVDITTAVPQIVKDEFTEICLQSTNSTILPALNIWLKTESTSCSLMEGQKKKILSQTNKAIKSNILIKDANIICHIFDQHHACPRSICYRGRFGELDDATQTKLKEIMQFLVDKTPRLVEGEHTNTAESFVAVKHMMLGGRRVNTQGRGVYDRQAKLAGLVKDRGYSCHPQLLAKMGFQPSEPLLKLAETVAARRIHDLDKMRCRRSKAKNQTDTGYEKDQVAREPALEVPELNRRKTQLMQKAKKIDREEAKKLWNVNEIKFLDIFKQVFLSTSASKVMQMIGKNLENPSEAYLLSLTSINSLHSWPVIDNSKEKLLFEKGKNLIVVATGFHILESMPFLASKPDGLVKDQPALFRFFNKQQSDQYFNDLAQIDLLCTKKEKAYFGFMEGGYLRIKTFEKGREEIIMEKLSKVETFYYRHIFSRQVTVMLTM